MDQIWDQIGVMGLQNVHEQLDPLVMRPWLVELVGHGEYPGSRPKSGSCVPGIRLWAQLSAIAAMAHIKPRAEGIYDREANGPLGNMAFGTSTRVISR
jgi:hypothetical protein